MIDRTKDISRAYFHMSFLCMQEPDDFNTLLAFDISWADECLKKKHKYETNATHSTPFRL